VLKHGKEVEWPLGVVQELIGFVAVGGKPAEGANRDAAAEGFKEVRAVLLSV